MAVFKTPQLPDDLDPGTLTDGMVPVYDSTAQRWVPGSGTSGTGIQNVSGTVNLDDTPGIREVYATASSTVEGVALTAGDAAVFRYLDGAWTYMVVGTHTTWQTVPGAPPADTTPPTGGTLTVSGTGDAPSTRTLTVTGASDAGGLHAQPYRFSTNGGTTWSTYQTSNAFTTAALAAGTYQPRATVRDAAGNTTVVSAADFTLTAAPTGPTMLWEETFTYPDGTDMVGKAITLTTGGTATIQQSSAWFASNLIGVAGKPCPVSGNRAVAPVATSDKTGGGINPAAWSGLDAAVEIVYDVTAATNAAAGLNMTGSAAAYRVFGDGRLFRGGTQVSTGHPTTGTLRLEHTGGDTITAKINGVVVDTAAGQTSRVTGTFGIDRAAAVDTFRGWLL